MCSPPFASCTNSTTFNQRICQRGSSGAVSGKATARPNAAVAHASRKQRKRASSAGSFAGAGARPHEGSPSSLGSGTLIHTRSARSWAGRLAAAVETDPVRRKKTLRECGFRVCVRLARLWRLRVICVRTILHAAALDHYIDIQTSTTCVPCFPTEFYQFVHPPPSVWIWLISGHFQGTGSVRK